MQAPAPALAQPEHGFALAFVVFSLPVVLYFALARASGTAHPRRSALLSGLGLGACYGVVPRLLAIFGIEKVFADLSVPWILVGMPFLSVFLPTFRIVPGLGSARFPDDRKMSAAFGLAFALGSWATFIGSLLFAAP